MSQSRQIPERASAPAAQVMGNAKTYGKGRIQSVFELGDGSGLFVTVAMYETPSRTIIDKVRLGRKASAVGIFLFAIRLR